MEAGVSIPQPLQLGIELKKSDRLRYFGELGLFTFSVNERGLTSYGLQGGFRWFPKSRGLYGSLGGGFQRLAVSAVLSALKVEDEVLADAAIIRMNTFFIIPTIGYVFQITEKMTLASEIGLQIPIFAWGDLYLKNDATGETSSNSETLRVNSRNYISRLSTLPLPQLTLFRFSWAL